MIIQGVIVNVTLGVNLHPIDSVDPQKTLKCCDFETQTAYFYLFVNFFEILCLDLGITP